MAVTSVSLLTIECAIREVCKALEHKAYLPPPWRTMTEDNLWREVVACILGSRVRFNVAHAAVERMGKCSLLSGRRRTGRHDDFEHDVLQAISGNAPQINPAERQSRYPFTKLRSKHIRAAAERLYSNNGTIRSFLEEASNVKEARRSLATEVAGLGPKQASLFLRNIGYASHVAILDIHVLTYMNWIGLTDVPLKSISTIRRYETLEDAFIRHSGSMGYPPDRFDLAVWVVVRVAKEEYESWG